METEIKKEEVLDENVEKKEQVEDTPTLEDTAEVDETKETKTEEEIETDAEDDKVTLTKEELLKKEQSISSKAKNEILKELGITSIAEAKAKFDIADGVEEIKSQLEFVTNERDYLQAEKLAREDNEILETVGVGDEFKDEFLSMLNAVQSEDSRLEKAIKLVAKMGKMIGASNVLGNQAQPTIPKEDLDAIELARLRKL